MITYTKYEYTESGCANVLAKLKDLLDNVGIFESTTLDSATNTVLCYYGGNEIAEFTIEYAGGGGYGLFSFTFGNYAYGSQNLTGDMWIGATSNAVMFYYSGNQGHCRLAVCKSMAGAPMVCIETNNNITAVVYDTEATTFSGTSITINNSSYFSNLCGIPTIYSGAEFVSAPNKVYRYVDRQTSIGTNGLSIIEISGTRYLTDGVVCASDS